MNSITGSVVTIVILVMFSAYFSATETAFTSLNRIKVKNLAADGNKSAERVLKLSDNYDNLLSTILIGNNIVNIAVTAIATTMFIRLYGSAGPTIATVVMTLVVLVFGEITPKSVAKEYSENFSAFSAPLIRVLVVLLTPVNFIFACWKKLILKILKVNKEPNITEEELKTMVEEAETEGSIEADQRELIQNAIEFKDLTAEEVMTPRTEIVGLEIDASEEEVADLFRDSGFSRILIYEDDLDKIQGVLNQKDFHNYIRGTGRTVSDFVKPVVFVAESMRIATLLKKMQSLKTHMSVVVDEYGGTQGLVTMEDIIEELVGEIYDEHDAIMSQEVTQLQNGSYRVMCNASLVKVFDFFGLDAEEIDANTVNGWVMICLDRLPAKGDVFTYERGNVRLHVRVTKATSRKALEINVVRETIREEEEDEKKGA
ncbi:MAG: hemolysin family protein [Eubacteriales bacterium]|jgi:putative hemolysin|nr:hemolysin family protein [Eubacteriales bacterium]